MKDGRVKISKVVWGPGEYVVYFTEDDIQIFRPSEAPRSIDAEDQLVKIGTHGQYMFSGDNINNLTLFRLK